MAPTTSRQIRAARAMLDWSMLDLARAAGVSVSTVKRIEAGEPQSSSDGIRQAVLEALESAGMRFLSDDGQGAGIRLRLPGSEASPLGLDLSPSPLP